MSTHSYFNMLKKLPGVAGMVVGVSVLISLPVQAQSEPKPRTSSEASILIAQTSDSESDSVPELSPEGLEILCERFPLNSRCEGGTTGSNITPSTSDVPDTTETMEPELDTTETIEPDLDTTESAEPDVLSPSTPAPSGTYPSTAPPSNAPGTTPGTFPPTNPEELDPSTSVPDEVTPGSTMEPGAATPDGVEGADALTPGAAESTTGAVSPEELQQFANVLPQLQEVEQAARQEVAQLVAQSGLSGERFAELYEAQQSPSADAISTATPEEQQSFVQAASQIQAVEQEVQSQQEQVLQSEGLEPERFSQILAAIRQDPTLQQQIQQLIQN